MEPIPASEAYKYHRPLISEIAGSVSYFAEPNAIVTVLNLTAIQLSGENPARFALNGVHLVLVSGFNIANRSFLKMLRIGFIYALMMSLVVAICQDYTLIGWLALTIQLLRIFGPRTAYVLFIALPAIVCERFRKAVLIYEPIFLYDIAWSISCDASFIYDIALLKSNLSGFDASQCEKRYTRYLLDLMEYCVVPEENPRLRPRSKGKFEKEMVTIIGAGHVGAFKFLRQKRGLPWLKRVLSTSSPPGLMVAVIFNKIEMVKYFAEDLDISINDTFVDEDESTNAVSIAVGQRRIEILEYLLLRGCDIKTPVVEDRSIMELSFIIGDLQIVKMLLQYDHGVHMSELIKLAVLTGRLPIVKLLRNYGAPLNRNYVHEDRIYTLADVSTHEEIHKWIISHGGMRTRSNGIEL